VGPSTPVEVLGLSGVPEAGETLNTVADEKQAKELVEHRRDSRRKKELAGTTKVSLENILERIKEGAVKELKVVLKADVQGSSEALKSSLTALATEQVQVDVISAGVGGITESDVNLAKAGNAIIVGFHVRPAGKAQQLAEQEGVDIKLYDIIYEALDDVKKAMVGLLAPVKREKAMGKAEVRQTFTIPKIGTICGSFVIEGTVKRNAQVRLVRNNVQIYVGRTISGSPSRWCRRSCSSSRISPSPRSPTTSRTTSTMATRISVRASSTGSRTRTDGRPCDSDGRGGRAGEGGEAIPRLGARQA